MEQNISVKKILVSLIKSIDLYNYLLKDHHRRTAIISYHLANHFKLPVEELRSLVLAASLHDIGAMYVNERDKLLELDVETPEPHEKLGEQILEGFAPFKHISRIIRHHHIKYEDVISGRIHEKDVPRECYFLHLADRIDVLYTLSGDDRTKVPEITEKIMERFGTVFAPFLKETFKEVTSSSNFWLSINQSSFHELLINNLSDEFVSIDMKDIRDLALVFSRIVDFKSPWTLSHSQSVGVTAKRLGELMGLDEKTCFELEIAGLLHDIGKIGIPSEILDKPDALTDTEEEQMRLHALYTSLILGSLEGFENIAQWASSHHEKRDQSGYPMSISSMLFRREMDILAFADIFSALTEDRPYRKHFNKEEALRILQEYTPEKLDPEVYAVIEANIDEIFALLEKEKQKVSQHDTI